MTDSPLYAESVVNDDAFRAALGGFEATRRLPAPEESSPAWAAWDAACIEAYDAVVACVDHYCARRVLDALAAALGEREAKGGDS